MKKVLISLMLIMMMVCSSCSTLKSVNKTPRSRYAAADALFNANVKACIALISGGVVKNKKDAQRILYFVKEGKQYLDLWSDALLRKLESERYEKLVAQAIKSLIAYKQEFSKNE